MNKIISVVIAAMWLGSCSSDSKKETDIPTRGKIRISVDESFYPLIDAELDTFHEFYKYAEVVPSYTSEQQAVNDVLNDSSRLAIITRELTPDEKSGLDKVKITPRYTKIAVDGLAFLLHPSNPDSLFTVAQIKKILSGEIKDWALLSGKGTGPIKIIFDREGSGTSRYLREKIAPAALDTSIAYAGGSQQVLHAVSADKNAIGVIGVNWISDGDSPLSKKFLNVVKVAAISGKEAPTGINDYFQPYQAYFATKDYPFTRDLMVVSREARTGLGTGFASHLAGEKGQIIIMKSGLLPATVPVRLVNLKQTPVN